MATAPPAFFDPSQIHLTMPSPPPPPFFAPMPPKSRLLDVLKIIVGLLIALILGAILAAFIFLPRTPNGIDLRESNEKIAELQRESNEKLARLEREANEKLASLEREQQLYIENERQKRQENLTEQHRFEDRLTERAQREQDLQFAREQSRQQLEIEEKRLQILLEEQQLAEQHRKEDLNRKNGDTLSDFMQEVMAGELPLHTFTFVSKVYSLIRQFDPIHKSLLINFLYNTQLLSVGDSTTRLDLSGVNLKELDLDSSDVDLWLNYTRLSLPATNLINASLEKIYLNEANFSMCNLEGASFHWSEAIRADFHAAKLSLTDFRYAHVSQGNFSRATIQRASFQNANLSQANFTSADLQSTKFQDATAIETYFFLAELSYTDFQYANLFHARMNEASMRSANFYSARAIQADFSRSYMPGCIFQWADLSDASFRSTYLVNANFDTANVQNADFTGAILNGANITPGQLDTVLSIAKATLPDGSTGKNKNLVRNGEAQYTGINGTTLYWTNSGNVMTNEIELSTECVFQARTINATLQQKIDVSRYTRLIELDQSHIYIEMEEGAAGTLNPSAPPVYMNVRFFDSKNDEIGTEKSSLNATSFTPPATFTASLPCPVGTVELQVTVVFKQANATVDNIYVTIE